MFSSLTRSRTTTRSLSIFAVVLFLLGPTCRAGEPALVPLRDSVEKYGRIEFRIDLDRQYARPFDPSDVDLELVVEAPSGRQLAVPAFFFQPCQRRTLGPSGGQRDWVYPAGEPQWMARFAPTECGLYHAAARLTDDQGTTSSNRVSFESTDSKAPGFLSVRKETSRYLVFDNGTPFFAIGQNLAFIGPTQYMTPSRTLAAFEKLAGSGANFLRIWTGCEDWALAIESPRSAWGRSWNRDTAVAELPGGEGKKAVRIDDRVEAAPCDAIPVRPDTEYVLTGKVLLEVGASVRIASGRGDEFVVATTGGGHEQSFEHVFRTGSNEYYLNRITLTRVGNGTAWLTALSLRETAGGPNLLGDADPNLPRRGIYHQIDACMLDEIVESARKHGLYLQLCVTMRDLYMQALAKPESKEYGEAIRDAQNLLRYFVARWGYSTSVAAWEYFNEIDPGKPTDRFYRELGEYLDRVDPYDHPRTTSTWSSSHRDWQHADLDVAEAHFYLRPSSLKKTPDVVAAVLDQTRDLREHSSGRPMFLAEFGLADEKWGLSPRMQEDQRLEHFHNALWASSLSGLSGTAMFWWWDQLDRRDAYHHYRPLADFLKSVPFGTTGLEPEQLETTGSRKILAIGLKGPQTTHFWLYDGEHSWERGADREADLEIIVSGAVLPVSDLPAGTYTVEWWDTWNGRVVRREEMMSSGNGVELAVPDFSHDIACRMVKRKPR